MYIEKEMSGNEALNVTSNNIEVGEVGGGS